MTRDLYKLHRLVVAALLTWTLLLAVLAVPGCPAGQTQIARVTVLSLGGAVQVVHAEHQAVYARAVGALRDQEHDGGSLADYNVRVAPLRAAFLRRSAAIGSLDRDLYAAAAVTDAVRQGADRAMLAPMAARVLAAIDASLTVLRDGDVLPAVTIPHEVTDVTALLVTLAGVVTPPQGGSDAGH